MKDSTRKLAALDGKYVWHPFTQMADWLASEPVIIDSAEGFFLRDTDGRRYIDAVSSLWCNVHGHRVKKIDEAIKAQLDRVAHSTLLGLGQSRSIELAKKLLAVAPFNLKKVFYSDSGATAVEVALKIAFQYFYNKGRRRRTKFIALEGSYHGDTIGAVSVGGIGTFRSIFRPLLFEAFFVPSPHPYRFDGTSSQCVQHSLEEIERLLKNRGDEIAAVIVEPLVQAAGGMIVHPPGFLQGVRKLTERYGILLIADEVATGFGRTGEMFACQKENVEPDIMCLAKGITGGYLPLAATLTTHEIFDAFLGAPAEHKTFYHGHTYTGNALACAAAIASLELFEENNLIASLEPKIQLMRQFLQRVAPLPFVGDVRQCGMMGAIEIVRDKQSKESFPYHYQVGAKLCLAMRSRAVMMRPLADCIVIMPPIAIEMTLLEKLLTVITEAVQVDLPKIVAEL
jgi:adenosylmethionine-8-amino-7-oxononanoate aminotransferase